MQYLADIKAKAIAAVQVVKAKLTKLLDRLLSYLSGV